MHIHEANARVEIGMYLTLKKGAIVKITFT